MYNNMIKLHEAITFATEKHKGQKEDNGQPYINHPLQTMQILRQVTTDITVLAAAVLHDTLEDTNTTYEELVSLFGEKIANLVREVTHTEKNVFPYLKTREGIMIKFADRLSNLSRMHIWSEEKQADYIKRSTFWSK